MKLEATRVEAREIDGEIVIYDLETRSHLGGNRTATVLWPMLVAGTDREALGERLCSEYAIDAERARADVDAFLSSLAARGLLTEQPG